VPGQFESEPWYTTAFDSLYPVLYAHRSVEAARREAAFALEQLHLRPGACLLDLCCGAGRHLVHLMQSHACLSGLDFSRDLLRIARAQLPPGVRLVRGDMRALPYAEAFDGIVNFFTSYGYFEADEENQRVLKNIAAALRPGGRFFMDYLNPDNVRETLVPESERELAGFRVVEKRWIDPQTERVNKITRVYRDDALHTETSESVRLYSFADMLCALRATGLNVSAVHGDFDGRPFSREAPRMLLTAERA
jgi:SAM-dependent methyltransferase